VGPDGLVDLEQLRGLVGRDTGVVSIQTANHETGVMQPVEAIGRRIRRWAPGAVFHTDAVQAAAWLDLPEVTGAADLVTISGHKFGGPQGIGALGIRNGVEIGPVIHGGGQERERRSGTPNVAAIVGLAAAVDALARARAGQAEATARRRDLLAELITAGVPDAVLTAAASPKVPSHCHFRFPGVANEELLFLLDQHGICASAGAACASGAIEPSPVLLAMGVDKAEALSSLRLTLGPTTGDEDVRAAAAVVTRAVTELRSRP
jgi:cysteine desulfurase